MCRVLILDDERYFAETIASLLKDEDEAHPDITVTAEAAVEKVTQAIGKNKPYDILMIDYRLGPEKDGIAVFKELRAISPDSDGIIFTGYDDVESGLLAYQAGAFRYLPKTTSNQELLFVFRALQQFRKEQREHNWQKIFGEVMEASIREKDFHAVAHEVVRYSLNLGFTRAHLFWTPMAREANLQGRLLGIDCAGEACITNFKECLFPLDEWIDLDYLQKTRSTIFLRNEDVEKARVSLEMHGYQPPAGEMILLLLWSSDRLLGVLLLDHGPTNKALSNHERGLLNFYARQVSLALEHAGLYTKEQKATHEQAAANQIGQEITAEATNKSLNEILEEVRRKLGVYVEIDNFTAILLDEERHELDLRLDYRDNQPCAPARQPVGAGLAGWFLARGQPLLIAADVAGFARQNGIQLAGETPSSWLGIPLQVSGKLIGGMILQKFQEARPFIKNEEHLLTLIADQVSGAIQNCRVTEKERRDVEKLSVLSRAGVEMLKVARENEENLWKVALTIATANFGVGFNRAMLFLEAEEATLIGRAAIGTEDADKAMQDWQADELRHYTFNDFLEDLRTRKLKQTDFDTFIQKIEIPLAGHENVFTHVFKSGSRMIMSEAAAQHWLPEEITSIIKISSCAVLPMPSGQPTRGVVLVDNKHNGKDITENDLDRLQTVLNYAGLIWETIREHDKSENLLIANQDIMSHSGREKLHYTLARVCNAALGLTDADWDIIYPLVENNEKIEFDTNNISYAGELRSSIKEVIKKRPGTGGMTAHILKFGGLFISDVSQPGARFSNKRIENHKFIKSEGVKAIIGMNIQDPYTDKSLGVFYLNYREPREFSELDIRHAQSFASLAAFIIANSRRMDEQKQRRRLEAALQTAQEVGSSPEQAEMLKNMLTKLHKVFDETTLCVLTYDEADNSLKFAPGALDFYKITNSAYRRVHTFPINSGSIACTVARRALKSGKPERENVPDVHQRAEYISLITDTQSELCVSLMASDKKLLGVLALERRNKFGFDEDDEALVTAVAQQLSLGLERFRQREQVSFSRNISTLTAWAADMAHEINNEAFKIQTWAYLIKESADDSEAVRKYAENLDASARQLTATTPRSIQGRLPIPLDETIKKYGEPIARTKNIELQILPGAENIYVSANHLQFRQVLHHLIINASRAMSSKKHKKIVVSTNPNTEDGIVEIQFQDFGPGVSEKVRPFLFQAKVTTNDQKNQGGYGLLITRLLVEEMGGSIRLLPKEPGKGAVFSIKLPIARLKETGTQ